MNANVTNNKFVNEWIAEMADLVNPSEIILIDGSLEQTEALRKEACELGEIIKLNQDLYPNCYLHRTAINDVARVEDRTFICTSKKEDAGNINNWMDPQECYAKLSKLYKGSYKNKPMYVIPYSMSVVGSAVVLQHVKGIHQANGLFPHQNSMGMFMNLIAPIFFAYYFNINKGWKRFLFAAFFLFASAACMRTYSRGSMVCLPFGCAITTLLSLRYQFHMRKVQILLPIALICFFGALLLLPNIIKRFENAPKESLMTRQYLAASAWNMMKDKPFVGVGLNNWGIKINPPYPYCEYRYANKRIAKDFREGIVETSYLLVGAECGFFALGAFLLWLGYYYVIACKLLKFFRRSHYFYIPAGIVGGLTAIYLQSTLEWVMKQQVNFIQMMMLFAVLSILYKYRKEFLSGKIEVAV